MSCQICKKEVNKMVLPVKVCEGNHIACKKCAIRYIVTMEHSIGEKMLEKSKKDILCLNTSCKHQIIRTNIIENPIEIKNIRNLFIENISEAKYIHDIEIISEEYRKNLKRKTSELNNKDEMVKIKKEKMEEIVSKTEEELNTIISEKNTLKDKYIELEQSMECGICMENKSNTVLLPCMHCYCEN